MKSVQGKIDELDLLCEDRIEMNRRATPDLFHLLARLARSLVALREIYFTLLHKYIYSSILCAAVSLTQLQSFIFSLGLALLI